MKKITQVLTVLSACGFASLSYAADVSSVEGRVNFTGKVYAQTCQLNDETKNKNVPLPDVRASELMQSGQTAKPTPFKLDLTGCTKGLIAGLKFDQINVDAGNAGTLRNIAAGAETAQNVNIQILANGQPLTLNTAMDFYYQAIDADDVLVSYPFEARYYATGKTTAGEVKSYATFKIDYK